MDNDRHSLSGILDHFIVGDCRDELRKIPDGVVDIIITSPPYYGQRNYRATAQIGSESTPHEYLTSLVEVFQECRRVLADTGTLWLNIGDKYLNGHLLGLPWRLAIRIQDDLNFILRSDIIWHKPNAMPSSVKNRPTTDHEYIFFFAKSADYYYDADAIREPHVTFTDKSRMKGGRNHFGRANSTPENGKNQGNPNLHDARWDQAFHPKGRNKRTVWEIPLSKFRDAHFAVFPEKLVETCLLAGSKPGSIVLDPFMGSGTTALVATKHNRRFIGIDSSEDYCDLARRRVGSVQVSLAL